MAMRTLEVVPILRIFSVEKAREFYIDYAGFKVDWEHRFDDNAPLYMQVSRNGLTLHLSEHYGDGSPGVSVHVRFEGVRDLHAELAAKNYGYLRPGITKTFWETDQLNLLDPFGNKIHLCEPKSGDAAGN